MKNEDINIKNNSIEENSEYKVLDMIAKDFSLKRKNDYALGDVGDYLMSLIKDKSGVNELNFVFKKLGSEEKKLVEGYVNSIKGKYNIAKYKVMGENLSIVIPKMKNSDLEYKLLKELIVKVTEDLKPIAKGESLSSASIEIEELKKNFSTSEEDDKLNAKKALRKFFTNRWVDLILSILVVILIWVMNQNTSPMNYIIPFITPFILFFITRYFSKEALSLKMLLAMSLILTIIGLYLGTFTFYKVYIVNELNLSNGDILYNINRGYLYGDTIGFNKTIIPLAIGAVTSVIGSVLTISYATYKAKEIIKNNR